MFMSSCTIGRSQLIHPLLVLVSAGGLMFIFALPPACAQLCRAGAYTLIRLIGNTR